MSVIMRTPLVAANWKMNMTVEGARSLVYAMSAGLREIAGVEKVLCPPFPALLAVHALLAGQRRGLGRTEHALGRKGRVYRRGITTDGERALRLRDPGSF